MQPTTENTATSGSSYFYTQKHDFLIIYTSMTGNTKRFVNKLDLPSVEWNPNLELKKPFFFVTYTTGKGEIPKGVSNWLEKNKNLFRGVASSGNINFKENYAAAGKKLSKIFNVPLVSTFEISGTKRDVELFKERILWLLNSN